MKNWTVLAFLATQLVSVPHAQASARAPQAVRRYFAALERKDFGGALKLTTGEAQDRTARMVGTLEREAAQHHARFELKVRSLYVAEGPAEDATTVPVTVTFDIDVIGKKWIFRRVARHLSGTAQFLVDEGSAEPRIVAILGQLE